tara:strand:+ start:17090 stop:17428 length:339 start_codon:yes stop_codon:yes gene_type:complete
MTVKKDTPEFKAGDMVWFVVENNRRNMYGTVLEETKPQENGTPVYVVQWRDGSIEIKPEYDLVPMADNCYTWVPAKTLTFFSDALAKWERYRDSPHMLHDVASMILRSKVAV